jgi:hypothetical protein
VSSIVNPGVNNFDLLRLKCLLLFCCEKRGTLHHLMVTGVPSRSGGVIRTVDFTIAANHTCLVLLRRYLTFFVGRFCTSSAHHWFIYLVDRELFHLLPKRKEQLDSYSIVSTKGKHLRDLFDSANQLTVFDVVSWLNYKALPTLHLKNVPCLGWLL